MPNVILSADKHAGEETSQQMLCVLPEDDERTANDAMRRSTFYYLRIASV